MAVIDLQDVKDELNITNTSSDFELMGKLEQAEAAYAELVRPLPGTYTETVPLPWFLPSGVTSATVPSGVTYDARTGMVSGYGRTAEVTYTVGPIPLHHEAAIIADLAEWWTRTQRGGGPSRPSFGGDAALDETGPSRPLVLFPRIRALAVGGFA